MGQVFEPVVTKYIEVPFSFYRTHKWEKAPDEVKFLKEKHPHEFKCLVVIEVFGDDRELEFYLVRNYLNEVAKHIQNLKDETLSCEQMADIIYNKLTFKYGLNRKINIRVTEDGVYGVYAKYQKLFENFKEVKHND